MLLMTSAVLMRIENALTELELHDSDGNRLEGLLALSAAAREFDEKFPNAWEENEERLRKAIDAGEPAGFQIALAEYEKEALDLIHFAGHQIRSRRIARMLTESDFCEREVS